MISHDNLTWTVRNFVEALPFPLNEEDASISYLPLSHVAAQVWGLRASSRIRLEYDAGTYDLTFGWQMLDIHCPIYTGNKIYFAQPDALRGSLGVTLKEVRPTYFFGVPRVWEKIYEAMQKLSRSTTGIKKALATWAKAKGLEKNVRAQFGGG
jgi:long-chain-fatty-acid--CoA ligase ACSBG